MNCPNGHPMDPSWKVCPYCPPAPPASVPAATPTVVEGAPAVPVQPSPPRIPAPAVPQAPPLVRPSPLAPTVREAAPGVPAPPAEPAKTVRMESIRSPVVGWLVDLDGQQKGQDFRIEDGRVLIGTSSDCQVRIENQFASAEHASLRYDHGSYVLTDLDSTNGTMVNEQPITRATLNDGDRVRIGNTHYVFKGLFLEEGEV